MEARVTQHRKVFRTRQADKAFLMAATSVVAMACLAYASSAHAQEAGSWAVKLGVNQIRPQVSSGNLSAPSLSGTKIDVKSATSLILTGTYGYTDNISVEAYIGLPYKHDVVGDGAIAGVGRLGTVKQVSPTIFAQYRFLAPSAPLRPYVGIGPTYAYFFDEQGSGTLTALTNPGGVPTRASVDSAWGVSGQVGITWDLQNHWYLDGSVIKTYVKTTEHLSTGQSLDLKLDPISVNLSIGYRF
jgi:outer membrane protein